MSDWDTPACALCEFFPGHEGEHRPWLTMDEALMAGIPEDVIAAAQREADGLLGVHMGRGVFRIKEKP